MKNRNGLEARLYRGTKLLSALAFIAFGLAGAAAFMDERGEQDSFLEAEARQVDCWQKKIRCDMSQGNEYQMTLSARLRNSANARKQMFLTTAVAIPAGLFLLFFAGRWVITGDGPKRESSQ